MPGSASSQVQHHAKHHAKLRINFPGNLLGRLLLLAALLGPDIIVLAIVPHTASLLGALAPLGIVSYAVLIGLGWSYFKKQKQELRFSAGYYAAHLGCVALVSLTNLAALHGFAFLLLSHTAHLLLRLTLLVGLVLLALAYVPARVWIKTARETGLLWLYAALSGVLAWCLRFPFQSLWDASATSTWTGPGRVLQVVAFHCVKAVLSLFLPDIHVNAATFTIGTPRFAIIVAEACSGMEGLGLVLVFTTVWLWYFRKESRFPQALLLVPVALVSVWMLNIARIALLVLIGNAGYGEIAMVGFHSQAGWIAFTTVAFGFSMATRKLSWVRRDETVTPIATEARAIVDEATESPATAAYLVPFLAILGASFVSKAGSGYFEWLYPLRFVAALIALWFSWPELKKIDWRFGWLAPVTGAGVFGLWLVPTLLWHASRTSQLGQSLAALSPDARWIWIAFRVAAASITVPIAEELAFRGYLSRRVVGRKFDAIPSSAVTLLPVALSSVAFGLMHGKQWLVGILAGLAFAGAMKWRGRISDAIVAHGTCNLLLAIWVLSRGDWAQW